MSATTLKKAKKAIAKNAKKQNARAMTRARLAVLVDLIGKGSFINAAVICRTLAARASKGWKVNLLKLAAFLESGEPQFTIIAKKGNSKLPFAAFSSLPGGAFCPGAGACEIFCYSFKGWRYPAAFCRQAQNAALLQTVAGRAVIARAFAGIKLKKDQSEIDFRLYVDGDFSSVSDVIFWMSLLATRPEIKAYGYSKSFAQLLEYDTATGGIWPNNYKLNISSGSNATARTLERAAMLPPARGEFIAVTTARRAAYGSREYAQLARDAFKESGDARTPFICPGKCGSCTPRGHACGSDRFQGIPIIIAAH